MITAKEIMDDYSNNRKEFWLERLEGVIKQERNRVELANGRPILFVVGSMNRIIVNSLIFELISVGFSAIYLEDRNITDSAIKISIPQNQEPSL